MSRIRLSLFAVLIILVLVLAPGRASAQCTLSYGNGFTGGLYLNNEGLVERPADIAIGTAAVTNCFEQGNVISISYNGTLSNPTAITTTTTNNVVIYNPGFTTTPAEGQLKVTIVTTTTLTSTGPQTVILITVDAATTDPAATITLQNLRFNVTGLSGTVLAPYIVNAYMSGTPSGPLSVSLPIGYVVPTINLADSAVVIGSGNQSSNGTLTTPAFAGFASPAIWPVSPFRVAIPKPLYPAGCVITVPPCDTTDLATTDTSLVFDIENIPSGVTVTFPPTMSVWPGVGAAAPTFEWKLRTTTPLVTANNTTGVAAIYDTIIATTAPPTVVVTTGASAADSTPGAVGGALPTQIMIGVQIAASSAAGTATLRVVFGPGSSAAFVGDDANATAIPNYIQYIAKGAVGREIITDDTVPTGSGVDGVPTAFFTILPTQTVLLYTYATDQYDYLTGLAVANTANDSGVWTTTTPGQTGPITFFFFPNGAAPFSYTAKPADDADLGLGASGLAPGKTFAASLDTLLTASGNGTLVGNFTGYVIVLCQFNFAHGYSIVFSPNTAGPVGTAANALVLGSGTRSGLTLPLPERLQQ